MTDSEVYAGAVMMGVVAGMRSAATPALLSQASQAGLLSLENSNLSFLANPTTGYTTAAIAAGEFIADKLPFIPKRTNGVPLAGRAISGALGGAAICLAKKRPVWIGVLLGASAAAGAAYATYELRRRAGQSWHMSDSLLAVMEDAFVAGAGLLITSRLRADAA